MTADCLRQLCTASYGRQSEMLEDHTYATWTAQSDTSTPPISTIGTGRRWRTVAVHGVRPSKKEPQKCVNDFHFVCRGV